MFKILVALIKSPKARAIVWAHLTHPSRWTVGECVAVVGPIVLGLSLLLLWPSPVPQPETPHAMTVPIATQVLVSNSNEGVVWGTLPISGDKGSGTINGLTSGQVVYFDNVKVWSTVTSWPTSGIWCSKNNTVPIISTSGTSTTLVTTGTMQVCANYAVTDSGRCPIPLASSFATANGIVTHC